MPDSPRRRRDPEARRNAIVLAAAELIVEVGVDAITHRKVAARADVPLGATTQYFATLDDLREAALQLLVAHVEEQLQRMRDALAVDGSTPAAIAAFLSAAMADAPAVRADRAVVTAAVHDPKLRELARTLSLELVAILEPVHGSERAMAAAVFLDGVLWHSQINDVPLPRHIIETALAGILGDDSRTTDRTTDPREN
ncbi:MULTISPECIES: TetR family transcriptional regulator [unclassified Microbacterium]|uniref:TetR/AcrR family transcriptional regulator n=1 Tax=unclassified Microbacterium TaxID=2609290 RepID=UPI001D5A8375|nr:MULTISPECIES: TetR family transcriptional regulator [unclassified Microbacterium]CAH0123130.1 HTH-type transcriptional regulator RcdA [Microbacterium sp. Bi121]HWK79032.1 TetR family transcriptional regulator [Microbacterium sp.]